MNKLMCKNITLENCCQVRKKKRGELGGGGDTLINMPNYLFSRGGMGNN